MDRKKTLFILLSIFLVNINFGFGQNCYLHRNDLRGIDFYDKNTRIIDFHRTNFCSTYGCSIDTHLNGVRKNIQIESENDLLSSKWKSLINLFSFDQIKDRFEYDNGSVRIIALLSPT